MKQNQTARTRKYKVRLAVILFISILVIVTGTFFALNSFKQGNVSGGILGALIAVLILVFAAIVFKKGNKDLKNGFPIEDERSKRVLEKASSTAFYLSLYLLLGIGFLSDSIIRFRDVSQATSIAVGFMAFLFLIFWVFYNKREV